MIIRVNGAEKEIPAGTSITGLLSELDIRPVGIAVEVNREVVTKRLHCETTLNDGDAVEIIRMVGGG